MSKQDRAREAMMEKHLGTKVRFSVQRQAKNGEWYDLNQNWENAKKAPFSVTRTIEDARTWRDRYAKAHARNFGTPLQIRIVKVVTDFTEVQ